jgi:hypothetical protein
LKNKELALKFINKFFPDAQAVIITGSSVNCKFVKDFSDIDLVILNNSIGYIYSELVHFDGVDFDVVILPVSNIELIIHNDIIIKRGKILHMLAKGEILIDRENIFSELCTLCEELLQIGPKPTTNTELKKLFVIIKGRIKDLKSENNNLIIQFLINEINQYLTSLFFALNNVWQGGARWNARLINEKFPLLANKILESTGCTDNEIKLKLYLDLIEEELHRFPEIIKGENVSFIENSTSKFYGINIPSKEYINFPMEFSKLKDLNASLDLVLIPNTDPTIDFTHIIILNSELLSVPNFLSYETKNYLYIPIENYSDISQLFDEEIFKFKRNLSKKSMELLLLQLNNSQNWNADNGIFLSMNLLLSFLRINNFGKEFVIQFCDFLVLKWSVYLNDNVPTTLNSIKKIQTTRMEIIQSFHDYYKKILTENYSSVYDSWDEIQLDDDYSILLIEFSGLLKLKINDFQNFGCWYKKSESENWPISQLEIIIWTEVLKSQFQLFGVTPNNLLLIPGVVSKIFKNEPN